MPYISKKRHHGKSQCKQISTFPNHSQSTPHNQTTQDMNKFIIKINPFEAKIYKNQELLFNKNNKMLVFQ